MVVVVVGCGGIDRMGRKDCIDCMDRMVRWCDGRRVKQRETNQAEQHASLTPGTRTPT